MLDTIVGDSKNSNNLCGLYILKEDKENFENILESYLQEKGIC